MKIAIITGHFIPEFGYQEVYLARAFARIGHEVCVFTTPVVPVNYRNQSVNKNYQAGIEKEAESGIEIRRLKTFFSIGLWVYSFRLKKSVLDFQPDVAIILAVGKLFPLPVLNMSGGSFRKYSILGNNSDFFNWQSFGSVLTSFADIIKNKLVRNSLYRKAVKKSDLLFSYTSETDEILRKMLNPRLIDLFNKKLRKLTLGFDPGLYFFDEKSFFETRKKYKIPEGAFVLVTSTRVHENKRLDLIINALAELVTGGKEIYYLIAGFQGDAYELKLKQYITEKKLSGHVICIDFASHSTLREIYCAADVAVWIKPSISILEAMGTGLFMLLENRPSMDHLLIDGENGFYFLPGELTGFLSNSYQTFSKTDSISRFAERKKIAKTNFDTFSYNVIAHKCLAG